MSEYPVAPIAIIATFWKHRHLIRHLAWRDFESRYRGSTLGLFWSFFNPIFMLTIYTFVFSVIFQAKWGTSAAQSKFDFAIILFSGLIIYNLFSEVINRSPSLILGNVNYVKRVVFPLEILSLVALVSSLFHTMISVFVLLIVNLIVNQSFSWTVLFLPIVIAPLMIVTLGCSWILASIGVYLRDVGQTVILLTTALLFLSPIFFPAEALPESLQPFLFLNPLALIIEQTRAVLIWGQYPDWTALITYLVLSLFFAWTALLWFQKTRKGFADVL